MPSRIWHSTGVITIPNPGSIVLPWPPQVHHNEMQSPYLKSWWHRLVRPPQLPAEGSVGLTGNSSAWENRWRTHQGSPRMQGNTYTGRFAMAPSRYVCRQICDGAFSPANFFTCRFDMAPSRLQHVLPSLFRPDGPEPPLRCRRFAYGYALDGSEFPCYLVWPQRDSRLQHVLPPDLRWHLLTCNMFYRQICDGAFSPAKFCTCR